MFTSLKNVLLKKESEDTELIQAPEKEIQKLINLEENEKQEIIQLQKQIKKTQIIEQCKIGTTIKSNNEEILINIKYKPLNQKLLLKINNNKSKKISKIRNEIKILNSLSYHPNIIQLITKTEAMAPKEIIEIEDHETKKLMCFYKKYPKNLKKYLSEKGNSLSIIHLTEICLSICNALLFLEKNKILHRNLKLSNILVDSNEKIILSGFGYAKKLDSNFCCSFNENEKKIINENYECNEIKSKTNQKSINFSKQFSFELGCLIHEILFTKHPFKEYTTQNNPKRIKLKQQNEISLKFLPIIDRLIDLDPNKRISLSEAIFEIQCPFASKYTISYFRQENNLYDCYYNLALCYKNGTNVQKNPNEVVRLYTIASEHGHAQSQNNLGLCYYNGNQILKQDYFEAVRLFTLAADQGFAPAQYNLANCYKEGKGVDKKNIHEAIRLYKLSADQGYARAQNNLGNCYKNGQGVEKDENEAFRLYKLSSDQGYLKAFNNLGLCYHYGTGVDKNISEAFRLYQIAANGGIVEAQFNLGNCYFYGEGVTKLSFSARYYYKLAADKGHSKPQTNLANLCKNDDMSKAFDLYQKASNSDFRAQFALGLCYFNGDHVEQSYDEAIKLFKLAAEQNYTEAYVKLAECYEKGIGVDIDISIAIEYYQLATDKGNKEAKTRLKQLRLMRSSLTKSAKK